MKLERTTEADDTDTMTLKCLDQVMEQQFQVNRKLNLTQARTKEEFFGFSCQDVWMLYYRKRGFPGLGLFFRLHDGRIFDAAARPHEPDVSLYEGTLH